MTIEQIRYYIALSKYKNFTRASEYLFVSQPTISKQINNLEKELGTKLFYRNRNGIELTAMGQAVYEDLKTALQLIDSAIIKVNKSGLDHNEELYIGVANRLDLGRVMPGAIYEFMVQYPNIKLTFSNAAFDELKEGLDGGKYDAIFTYTFEEIDPAIHSRVTISRCHTYLYYPESMAPSGITSPTMKDFLDRPLIHVVSSEMANLKKIAGFKNEVERDFFEKSIKVPNLETMLVYLESQMGVVIMGTSYRIEPHDFIKHIDLTETDGFAQAGTDMMWLKSNESSSLELLAKFFKNREVRYTE